MTWFRGWPDHGPRRRVAALPRRFDLLEARALLADGITAAPGAPLSAVAGSPMTAAVFATFTLTDASGAPGTKWRGHIDFGDGQVDRQVALVPAGDQFQIVDSHSYTDPGNYTVTVMIAVPGSRNPNGNTVTTQVTVTKPLPPPAIGSFQSTALHLRAKVGKNFHGGVARFIDPHTKARDFTAVIDWGDHSPPTSGRIQGRSRYVIIGSHRFNAPGTYQVRITIRDGTGQEIASQSVVNTRPKSARPALIPRGAPRPLPGAWFHPGRANPPRA